MKIFYITQADLTKSFGATRHITELCNSLTKIPGVSLRLFVPRFRKGINPSLDIPVTYVPTINIPSVKQVIFQTFLFFYLLYYLFKERPRIIYSRQGHFTITPIIFARLFARVHLTEINGIIQEEMRLNRNSSFQISTAVALEKINYHFTDKIITVNEGIKNKLVELFRIPPNKIEVIPNGVSVTRFYPIPKDEARVKLGWAPSDLVIGFVGQFMPWRGLEYLIQSLPHIQRVIPDLKCVLCGTGLMENQLKQLSQKLGLDSIVKFVGFVPPDEVVWYINAFDLAVVSLFSPYGQSVGSSPLKLYEYLACGKPVISADVPGVQEIIQEHKVGVIVRDAQPQKIADAVINILRDKAIREQMAQNARQAAVRYYSWEIVATKYLKVCRSALSKSISRTLEARKISKQTLAQGEQEVLQERPFSRLLKNPLFVPLKDYQKSSAMPYLVIDGERQYKLRRCTSEDWAKALERIFQSLADINIMPHFYGRDRDYLLLDFLKGDILKSDKRLSRFFYQLGQKIGRLHNLPVDEDIKLEKGKTIDQYFFSSLDRLEKQEIISKSIGQRIRRFYQAIMPPEREIGYTYHDFQYYNCIVSNDEVFIVDEPSFGITLKGLSFVKPLIFILRKAEEQNAFLSGYESVRSARFFTEHQSYYQLYFLVTKVARGRVDPRWIYRLLKMVAPVRAKLYGLTKAPWVIKQKIIKYQ